MTFNRISIKNFRNFEDVDFEISNRNIFFGLNDIGKTNFLYALRFVFDRDERKKDILESDFHNRNITKPIEILIEINLDNNEDIDCQKLRSFVKGGMRRNDTILYIKFIAEYDQKELHAIPKILWGSDINDLEEVKQKGGLF